MLLVAKRFVCLLALAALVVTAGCDSSDDDGGSDTPPPGTSQTFSGTLAGSSKSGTLTLTIDGTDVTGTLTLVGSGARGTLMPPLTGNFDPETGAITFSGGGFTFTGTISNGTLSGSWTGPDGASGSFTAYLHGSSDGDEVRVYCGTYDTARDDGTLNIVARGTDLLGMAVEYGQDDATGLRGRVNGRNITIWLMDNPQAQVATGTFSEDFGTASGSIAAGDGNTGTWSVSLCGG